MPICAIESIEAILVDLPTICPHKLAMHAMQKPDPGDHSRALRRRHRRHRQSACCGRRIASSRPGSAVSWISFPCIYERARDAGTERGHGCRVSLRGISVSDCSSSVDHRKGRSDSGDGSKSDCRARYSCSTIGQGSYYSCLYSAAHK